MLPSTLPFPQRSSISRHAALGVLALLAVLSGCAHDRRSIGAVVDDAAIELKATGILTTDAAFRDKVHVIVTSVNGIVLLTGETPTAELRDSVLASMRNIQSIRRIVNEITIAPPSTLSERTHDAWISSKLKTRLIGTKGLHASRVEVVTEHSAVYLLGLVNQQEAELATNAATAVSGVERVVKLFEYVD